MSSQLPCNTEIFCWMSTLMVSILAPSSNSSVTMDTLSWLVEVTVLSSVAMDCSTGLVMDCSMDSGLAPGSEVTMMT